MNELSSHVLTPEERRDRLRLIRSENVGPVTFFEFLRHFGSATPAIAALPALARRGGRVRPPRVCGIGEAEAELAAVARAGARLLVWGEPGYPAPLAAIEDAPPVLTLRGDPALLARPMIGMVGARNASANGRRFARQLARDLGESGLVVVSGLARGIDAEAHAGALATGTVAVLAGGVDIAYPEENARLQAEIAEAGLLLSEQPLRTVPTARHFPRRNRLISGLSSGVIVVEAAPRSGSLITARLALEQGREVFAVPGSPLDPRARGTNNLIREGATLTESADDVLRSLEPMLRAPLAERRPARYEAAPPPAVDEGDLAAARGEIAARLGPAPVPVDELVRQSGAPAAVVAAALLELELAGRLERHPGNQVALSAG